MSTVEPIDVAKFLGRGDDEECIALAGVHLPVVATFVEAYTRGQGFDLVGINSIPNRMVRSVIITATSRTVGNPEQVKRYQAGDYSETPATLEGFTLPELAVLNLYRRRTA